MSLSQSYSKWRTNKQIGKYLLDAIQDSNDADMLYVFSMLSCAVGWIGIFLKELAYI